MSPAENATARIKRKNDQKKGVKKVQKTAKKRPFLTKNRGKNGVKMAKNDQKTPISTKKHPKKHPKKGKKGQKTAKKRPFFTKNFSFYEKPPQKTAFSFMA
jgi:hypothetical protein